jgi:hypothetical protein
VRAANNNTMTESIPKLISLNKFLEQMGVTSTTAWRWRKRGSLKTVNIYGRLYVSDESLLEFHRRATAGEFAIETKPGKKADCQLIIKHIAA